MKTYLISIVIALIIGGFIGYSFHPDDKSQEVIQKYEKQLAGAKDSLNKIIQIKQREIDSLKSLEPQIIIKYREKRQNIDSVIATDSTNAIGEYREGLKTLNVLPDNSKDLTYREIGFGAKFFNQLRENIDLTLLKDQINAKQESLNKQLQSKIEILLSENELLKLKECDEPSFWYKRFPIILGGGIGYDIEKKNMSVNFGIYFGIRIN